MKFSRVTAALSLLVALAAQSCTDVDCSTSTDCIGAIDCDVPAYPACTVESYSGEEGSCYCKKD